MLKKDRSLVIKFATPAIVMFALVFLYPILRTILMSFFHVENITGNMSTWVFAGIENYQKLAKTEVFIISLTNLFKIWFYGGIVVFAISLLFAVILNSGIKYKNFFRNAIYMPYTIPAVALAAMWLQYVFNSKYGLLMTFFTDIGWESMAAIQWTDTEHKFLAMMIAYCFGMVGYHMVIFSSGIENIPSEYYEACRIDGCNALSQFWHITLPLLKGVMKTNLTMWSISSAGFFVWAQMFTSQNAESTTITPVFYLYTQIFGAATAVTERDSGLGSAVGVIVGVIIVLVFLAINAMIKDDELEM